MLKIDWNDESVPEWAKYIAMNADGEWRFFESPPMKTHYYWQAKRGKVESVLPLYHWRYSLQERPTND